MEPITNFETGEIKWGDPVLGRPSDEISWSTDYFKTLQVSSGTEDQFDAALQQAFDTWESVAAVNFRLDNAAAATDIRFVTGNVPDGVAGTASYTSNGASPVATFTDNSGVITFSDDLSWSPEGDGGGLDFFAVALHEIGHMIGLAHVDDPTQIMNDTIFVDELGQGDKFAAQSVYGTDGDDVPVDDPETGGGISTGGGDDDGGGAGAGAALGILGLLALIIGFFTGGAGAGAVAAVAAARVPDNDDDDAPASDAFLSEAELVNFIPMVPVDGEHEHHGGHHDDEDDDLISLL